MTDKELIELAAKAAGMAPTLNCYGEECWREDHGSGVRKWNPLADDSDALRLAVKLNLSADFFDDDIYVGYTPNCNDCDQVIIPVGDDPYAATRRAIVRAAAEVGKAMK